MADACIKIPAELFALAESSHFEGMLDLPQLAVGPDDYLFEEPLAWAVDVTNTGSALLVSGTVKGSAHCMCSRCLDDVACEFNGDIEGFFVMQEADLDYLDDDEDAPGADEFDVLPADHIINLQPLIEAALMVEAPTMPLCRENCAGLCPVCGANLNEGDCGCGKDPDVAAFDAQANPFAVLADFKFDEDVTRG